MSDDIIITLTAWEAQAYLDRAGVYERQSIFTTVYDKIKSAMPYDPPVDWSEDVGEIGQWIGELREFDSVTARAQVLHTDKGYSIACTHNDGLWIQLPSNFMDLDTAKRIAEKWLRNH